MAAEEAALEDHPIEKICNGHADDQARAEIGIHAQSERNPGRDEFDGSPEDERAKQKPRRDDLEERGHELVPAPAAESDVPAAHGEQERREHGHARTEE